MQRVRELRTEAGISQAELGRRAGFDHAVISRLESGKQSPNLTTLDRIADALGVDTADLLTRRREPVTA